MQSKRFKAVRVVKPEPKPKDFILMCIDPGLNGTGWAVFANPRLNKTDVEFSRPFDYGVVTTPRSMVGDLWHERAMYIANAIECVYRKHEPSLVTIEWPQTWVGSQTSMAATMSGDLQKMSFLIGLMCASREVFHLITPQEWKGQLPKEVVHRRILEQTGLRFPEHAADAVGMGLSLQESL